jgi:hypothetical protein
LKDLDHDAHPRNAGRFCQRRWLLWAIIGSQTLDLKYSISSIRY